MTSCERELWPPRKVCGTRRISKCCFIKLLTPRSIMPNACRQIGSLLLSARKWPVNKLATRNLGKQFGIGIGGLAFCELESGTTIAVLRLSFSTFTEITTQGRVLRISEPSVGSSATHQISPRSGITSMVLPFRRRFRQTQLRSGPHPGPDSQPRRHGLTLRRAHPIAPPRPRLRSANGRVRQPFAEAARPTVRV